MAFEVIMFGRTDNDWHIRLQRESGEGDAGRRWLWRMLVGDNGILHPMPIGELQVSTWPGEPSLSITVIGQLKLQKLGDDWFWVKADRRQAVTLLNPEYYEFNGCGTVAYRALAPSPA